MILALLVGGFIGVPVLVAWLLSSGAQGVGDAFDGRRARQTAGRRELITALTGADALAALNHAHQHLGWSITSSSTVLQAVTAEGAALQVSVSRSGSRTRLTVNAPSEHVAALAGQILGVLRTYDTSATVKPVSA